MRTYWLIGKSKPSSGTLSVPNVETLKGISNQISPTPGYHSKGFVNNSNNIFKENGNEKAALRRLSLTNMSQKRNDLNGNTKSVMRPIQGSNGVQVVLTMNDQIIETPSKSALIDYEPNNQRTKDKNTNEKFVNSKIQTKNFDYKYDIFKNDINAP